MRFVSLVLIFIVTAAMADSAGKKEKIHYDIADARTHFEDFKVKHNRQYKDQADEEEHFKAFVANLEKINELNAKDTGATYGINKFADYTEEERKTMFGHRRK